MSSVGVWRTRDKPRANPTMRQIVQRHVSAPPQFAVPLLRLIIPAVTRSAVGDRPGAAVGLDGGLDPVARAVVLFGQVGAARSASGARARRGDGTSQCPKVHPRRMCISVYRTGLWNFGHRNGTSPYFCDEGGAKPGLLVLIMQRRSNAAGLSPRAARSGSAPLERLRLPDGLRGCRRPELQTGAAPLLPK